MSFINIKKIEAIKASQPIEVIVAVQDNQEDSDDSIDDLPREIHTRQTTAKYRSYSSLSRTYENTIEHNHSALSNQVALVEKQQSREENQSGSPQKEMFITVVKTKKLQDRVKEVNRKENNISNEEETESKVKK